MGLRSRSSGTGLAGKCGAPVSFPSQGPPDFSQASGLQDLLPNGWVRLLDRAFPDRIPWMGGPGWKLEEPMHRMGRCPVVVANELVPDTTDFVLGETGIRTELFQDGR